MAESKYIGPSDVAKIIGVNAMTVRRIDEQALPFNITPGGHRRYREEDVLAYCRAKGIAPQAGLGELLKILLVDDDEQIVDMLRSFIETSAAEVEIEGAFGGFEAGMKVKTFKPDVIVTDILMPDLSGTRMCEMLKLDSETSEIRIIGVSGTTSEDEIVEFLNAGAEICLRKPVKRRDFLEALQIDS